MSERITTFRNNIYGCQMSATTVMKQPEILEKRNCGVARVRLMGTLRDWLVLKRKINYLDRFGCH
jgi:hypothetical protein